MSRWRPWSLAGAVASAVTTSVYLGVVASQGDSSGWAALPWVLLMVVGTAAALWSGLTRQPTVARSMAVAAAGILGVLGVLALLSVGMGFLLAAALAAVAAVLAGVTVPRAG